jgi:hypothetical protein
MTTVREISERLRAAPRGEVITLGLLTGVLALSVVWHPADDGGFVICPFRNVTGLPCLTCGLTRSFCAIAKGHVERGFEFHWLGPVLFLGACVYWIRSAAAVAGYEAPVARFDAAVRRWRVARAVLVALVVAWVVRLAVLGATGQLAALARQGALFRWL